MFFRRREPDPDNMSERELNAVLEGLHKQFGIDEKTAVAWADGYEMAVREIDYKPVTMSLGDRIVIGLYGLLLISLTIWPLIGKFLDLSCS